MRYEPKAKKVDEAKTIRTFEQVFEQESTAMTRLAFLIVRSEALAQEAAQDAFVKLLDKFDKIKTPGGFVRTATINRCHDLLRKKQTEKKFLGRFRPIQKSEAQPSELDDVLAGLNHDQRIVIVLRFYLGHEPKEIAQILDIAEGTVRSRLHRGIKELKGKIA